MYCCDIQLLSSAVLTRSNITRCCTRHCSDWSRTKIRVLTHWGRDKMDAISQTTFWSAFSWMKMFDFRLKFHWSLFRGVELTIFHHWFGKWLGAVQATSHYLNQWCLVYRRIYASLGLNELTHKRHPYLALTSDQWNVYYEDFGDNLPSYISAALYNEQSIILQAHVYGLYWMKHEITCQREKRTSSYLKG